MSYRSQTEENESEFMTFVNKTDQITLYAKLSFSFIRFEKKNNRKLIEIFLVFLDGNSMDGVDAIDPKLFYAT